MNPLTRLVAGGRGDPDAHQRPRSDRLGCDSHHEDLLRLPRLRWGQQLEPERGMDQAQEHGLVEPLAEELDDPGQGGARLPLRDVSPRRRQDRHRPHGQRLQFRQTPLLAAGLVRLEQRRRPCQAEEAERNDCRQLRLLRRWQLGDLLEPVAWSFRKSKKIGPGLRLNISKRSLSLSAGRKGARVSGNTKGRKSASLSWKGLFWRKWF
jgi:Protein of unknown function (DUF4236)